MEHGKLRAGDPTIAAKQFLALLNAETQILLYYRDKPKPTRRQIATFVERAVEVFMGGCGGRAHARREPDRTT
jgi:methionine synthase I (cobalamin-dependent)